jgi:vacuolar-type H+-ATPase subunit B/Vma2
MNSIACGKKIPIFSAAKLPHNKVATQIGCQTSLLQLKDTQDTHKENFVIVFGALGVGTQESRYTKAGPLPMVNPI